MRARIGCLGLVLLWLVPGQGNPLPAAETDTSAGQPASVQPGPKTLEELIGDLRSKKTRVRVAAADALGAMGAAAKVAIPDLIHALGDEDFWAGSAVTDALSTVGAPAVPALIEVVENGQGAARLVR